MLTQRHEVGLPFPMKPAKKRSRQSVRHIRRSTKTYIRMQKHLDAYCCWLADYAKLKEHQNVLAHPERLSRPLVIKKARRQAYYKDWNDESIPDMWRKPAVLPQARRDLQRKGIWKSDLDWGHGGVGIQYQIDYYRKLNRKLCRVLILDRVIKPQDSDFRIQFLFSNLSEALKFIYACKELLSVFLRWF